ncbi:MAG: hypothetical protein U9R08_03465 [Nanoarchaeota archaeon]|nr:hypothetical protein [Nanoarchaeota archaeon]
MVDEIIKEIVGTSKTSDDSEYTKLSEEIKESNFADGNQHRVMDKLFGYISNLDESSNIQMFEIKKRKVMLNEFESREEFENMLKQGFVNVKYYNIAKEMDTYLKEVFNNKFLQSELLRIVVEKYYKLYDRWSFTNIRAEAVKKQIEMDNKHRETIERMMVDTVNRMNEIMVKSAMIQIEDNRISNNRTYEVFTGQIAKIISRQEGSMIEICERLRVNDNKFNQLLSEIKTQKRELEATKLPEYKPVDQDFLKINTSDIQNNNKPKLELPKIEEDEDEKPDFMKDFKEEEENGIAN